MHHTRMYQDHVLMHNRYVHHGHMCQGQESMHRTCIQTSRSRMIHTLMHQSQGPGSQICASYTHASESRIEDHKYVHHTHMHQSQGSRNIDKCIIHACIRIMYPTPRIALFVLLLLLPLKVCPLVTKFAASQIHAPYIHACFRMKVQDHRYVHHTHMHHSQGSRNTDKCIIQACIRIMDHE